VCAEAREHLELLEAWAHLGGRWRRAIGLVARCSSMLFLDRMGSGCASSGRWWPMYGSLEHPKWLRAVVRERNYGRRCSQWWYRGCTSGGSRIAESQRGSRWTGRRLAGLLRSGWACWPSSASVRRCHLESFQAAPSFSNSCLPPCPSLLYSLSHHRHLLRRECRCIHLTCADNPMLL